MTVLVGKKAPNFKANAVLANNDIKEIDLFEYIGNDKAILFFYPLDFTFVCPSEIIAFNHRIGEFTKRNVKLLGISVDSQFSHYAWKNVPVNKGGIGNIQFPLVADITKSIARDYDVLINEAIALRGTFLIDSNKIVRHQVVNDLPLGRNVDEALRMVDALIHFENHGEVCPAGWQEGAEAIKPTNEGIADFLNSNADKL